MPECSKSRFPTGPTPAEDCGTPPTPPSCASVLEQEGYGHYLSDFAATGEAATESR